MEFVQPLNCIPKVHAVAELTNLLAQRNVSINWLTMEMGVIISLLDTERVACGCFLLYWDHMHRYGASLVGMYCTGEYSVTS